MRRHITICERCGREQGDHEPGMSHWAVLVSDNRLWRHTGLKENMRENTDLCPACAKDFGEWWQKKAAAQ